MLFANNCPYVYGFSYLETTKHSEQQIADDLMDDTFGSTNMVAVVVPAGDYAAEKKLLDELGTYDEVDSTLGLSNVEAMGGYMLTDALTPRQFSELTDLDYEVAELLYAAYAADGGNYGKIIGGLPNYSVPLIDMFTFLYGEMQDGYVTLDADMAETLESAYSQITNARKQLQSDDYTRMLVYLNLPVGGDETYDFLDQMRVVARKYYPDGEVYVVGDSSSEQDFKTSFSRDNVVVSVLSILIVLVVLLFTFKSAGIPVLLILVIQGSIWINYGIPTITNSPPVFPELSGRLVHSDGREYRLCNRHDQPIHGVQGQNAQKGRDHRNDEHVLPDDHHLGPYDGHRRYPHRPDDLQRRDCRYRRQPWPRHDYHDLHRHVHSAADSASG